MRETIGLLGGSFNPIHFGHLAMAEAALQEMRLDRLIIIPDGDPPHKSTELADKRHRLRMAEIAAAGRFAVSAMEVERPGKTYTIDTLEVLHALYPQAQLVMIIGADTLGELPTWKQAERVYALCQFAVFGREGSPLVEIPGVTALPMRTEIPDISATEIRVRVHAGQSLHGYTPEAVEAYIGANRLYGPPIFPGVKMVQRRVKEMLSEGRYRHVLGVVSTIERLAKRWAFDVEKARLAALLHDCARGMTLAEMNAYIDAQGEPADYARRTSEALLHGFAGAAYARAAFGVTDPEVLQAVRYHTTGHDPMGPLDKLLWLADMTEPGRRPLPWMEGLRALSMESLDQATQEAFRIKLTHLQSSGKAVHPDTAATAAAMEKEREGNL